MKIPFLFILGVMIFLISCKENEVLSPEAQITQVDLSITGLQNLGDSCWYEGWLVWGDEDEFKQTVGVFRVNDSGQLSPSSLHSNLGNLQQSQKFLISIEEDDVPGYQINISIEGDSTVIDSIEGPSGYQIMGAVFQGNVGDLSVGHKSFYDFDFNNASGVYMLDTPTDASMSNPESGIWFVKEDSIGKAIQGLNMPVLGGRWKYKGYVEIDGTPVSTGAFAIPGAADDSDIYSESTGVPYPFPGEDFLLNAPNGLTFPVNLSNSGVLIELVPPHPDNCNSPFDVLVPLATTVPANAQAGTIYEFQNNVSDFPHGTVTINIQIYN
jgi:hypothetical protein